MSALSNHLMQAVTAALPLDPMSDGEMVARWEVIYTSEEDRREEINLPECYSVPVIDDATPVARAAAVAALRATAEHFRVIGNTVHAMGDHLRAKGIDQCHLAVLDAIAEIENETGE